jgi:hypothetical protein
MNICTNVMIRNTGTKVKARNRNVFTQVKNCTEVTITPAQNSRSGKPVEVRNTNISKQVKVSTILEKLHKGQYQEQLQRSRQENLQTDQCQENLHKGKGQEHPNICTKVNEPITLIFLSLWVNAKSRGTSGFVSNIKMNR